MKNINYKIQKICLTAVFASLITVCIFSLKLPIASMQGYIHPGDFIIYLSTVFCGPYSLICSALGGALADIISGFPVWALPTAIIKALNCVPFLLINKKSDKCKNKILNRYSVGALIVSSFITVFGYISSEERYRKETNLVIINTIRTIKCLFYPLAKITAKLII